MDFSTLFEIPDYQATRFPQQVALAGRLRDQWVPWSTANFIRDRLWLSAGLLEAGYRTGDRIGILAHCGSPEWLLADNAMMQIGIIPVPIHANSRADEIAHIAKDADLKACFISDAAMLARFKAASTGITDFISFEETPGTAHWKKIACEPDEHQLGRIQYLKAGIKPEQMATLIYTSGTTGVPKGVMLSHQNIVSNVKSVLAIVPFGPSHKSISFLPLSHIFERMVVYTYLASGVPVYFADAIEKLPKLLPEVRPHFFSAVPRVLERMHERLLEERSKSGVLKRKIMDWAITLGEQYPYTGDMHMPPGYFMRRLLADWLVFRHWRKRMGGRVKYIAVGAAALQPRLGRLFSAAGIDVREGYGLTETSPVLAFNRFEPGGVHFGTVGIPAPGVAVRIAEEQDENGNGEIEVSGPNVMMGYYNLPEETAKRFTADGWFRTGDVGQFVHKRFLKITGRKGDIFKTSTGKFVAPAYVEQRLIASPYISQCMVMGLNRPFVGALIVPDFVQLEAWCHENQVHWTAPQYMIHNQKIEKLIQTEIDRINAEKLNPEEKVRKFALIHETWTPENGLLTPTLKTKRSAITNAYTPTINELFA